MNGRDEHGNTLLHIAAQVLLSTIKCGDAHDTLISQNGYKKLLKLLLRRGAGVNAQNVGKQQSCRVHNHLRLNLEEGQHTSSLLLCLWLQRTGNALSCRKSGG